MVKKGDTVKDFLQKVKEQLIPEFRELRWVNCAAKALQLANRLLNSQDAAHAGVTVLLSAAGPPEGASQLRLRLSGDHVQSCTYKCSSGGCHVHTHTPDCNQCSRTCPGSSTLLH